MKSTDSPSEVTSKTLQSHLLLYDSHVPGKIQGLEEIRLKQVPETLDQRKRDGEAFLEKAEVTALVEWKLKHGTYRPNLAKLVASNSVKDIRETSKSAFATYEADHAAYPESITALSKLKGIGPATASLLLSCYDPIKVPFFSDEIYRYLHWEDAKSKGWDRKISYTVKEYKTLYERLQSLRERLSEESGRVVSAIEIEKMAYVLGREAQNKSTDKLPTDGEDEEGDRALRPPSPKRRRKAMLEAKDTHVHDNIARIEDCSRKDYIIHHTEPVFWNVEQKRRYREREAEITRIGRPGGVHAEAAWDDRYARGLGIVYHELGPEGSDEWLKEALESTRTIFRI